MRPPTFSNAPPRDRRLLSVATMRGSAIGDLGRALAWRLVAVRHRLCALRGRGFGRDVTLWMPERCGRPACFLTYVALRYTAGAMTQFESWCATEVCITRVDLVAGRFDYQVWSWHADLRGGEAWGQELSLRGEVRAVLSRPVRVLSGHTLPGAPIFTAVENAQRASPE